MAHTHTHTHLARAAHARARPRKDKRTGIREVFFCLTRGREEEKHLSLSLSPVSFLPFLFHSLPSSSSLGHRPPHQKKNKETQKERTRQQKKGKRKNKSVLLLLVHHLRRPLEPPRPASGDEPDLLPRRRVAPDRRGVPDVLVVTATVRVLHGVHGDTADLGPRVALGLVLVVGGTGLQQRLLGTAAAGDLADSSTARRRNHFFRARGELDAGDPRVGVVSDHDGVVSRGTGDRPAVPGFLLDIADDGPLRHLPDGLCVPDRQGGLFAGVDELARVEALGGDEELLGLAVADGVVEDDLWIFFLVEEVARKRSK